MAKTYTFTAPPAAITDLAATLQSGGSLTASTTYYYVVVALGIVASVSNSTKSGISNEVSATTDTTNKTIRLDWTAITGAAGYAVFRVTTSGAYNTNCRIAASNYNATTTNNYFVDDGTVTANRANYCHSTTPTSLNNWPLYVDPRTYGLGKLIISGGTSGDPITPQNIYDDAVANGYSNYVKFDKGNLVLMCHFGYSNLESYFTAKFLNIYCFGYFYSSPDSATAICTYGVSGTPPSGGVHLKSLAGREDWQLYPGTYAYDLKIDSTRSTASPPYSVTSINTDGTYINVRGGTYSGVKAQNVAYLEPYSDTASCSGAEIGGPFFSIVGARMWDTVICTYHLAYNANDRLDNFIFAYANYQYMSTSHPSYPGLISDHIDCQYINSPNANKYPTCYWYLADDFTATLNVWFSIKLKVVNEFGTAINNASVTIKDSAGSLITDYNGGNIDYTSNSNGEIWAEKITVTSATTTTITDSSKSWTTNQWKGRNIFIKNQKRKIISNTATQITVNLAFTKTPSAGDTTGVITEIKRMKKMKKAGTGANVYGDANTTETDYAPFTLEIRKSGYKSYKTVFSPTAPMDLVVALQKVKNINFSKHNKIITQ